MTVHGGPTFREWQLGHLTGTKRIVAMSRWFMRDHPLPLVIRSTPRTVEDQAELAERWKREFLLNYRLGLSIVRPTRFVVLTGV